MAKEKKFTSTTLAPDDAISQLYRILTRANEIASNTELDDLLDQMLDLIIEVCGGNAGTLYLLDSEHGELEFKVIRGPHSDQSLIGKRIKTDLGIVGATMKQSQPLVIEDLVHDPREATGQHLGAVRIFLDSRHGRHFADDVLNQTHAGRSLTDAINAATQRWMGRKIGYRTSRDYGLPRGLPYLTGFVIQCEIAVEFQS